MSGWSDWAAIAVSILAVGVSIYAALDARQARKEAKDAQADVAQARLLAAIDQLRNEHDVRRSQWDPWRSAEIDLAGMRRAAAEWRNLCMQQMNLFERDTPAWVTIRDLAEAANAFSRATDKAAKDAEERGGFLEVQGDDEKSVQGAVQQFQERTREHIQKLAELRPSLDIRSNGRRRG